ncbi:MAG: thioesterase [Hyphomicrobiales bacterium]|nr:thioesterase [Hyphomicrobiales bacterium]
MSQVFQFEQTVLPDWIDYNGHMRDSYYGLIFSLAVDSLQDEVGFDEAYRKLTGCTIYLLEDHKYYLREVREGARVQVETRILDCDDKRFHLHMQMLHAGETVAIGEFMELHVQQRPTPAAALIPDEIAARLNAARTGDEEIALLKQRARPMCLFR